MFGVKGVLCAANCVVHTVYTAHCTIRTLYLDNAHSALGTVRGAPCTLHTMHSIHRGALRHGLLCANHNDTTGFGTRYKAQADDLLLSTPSSRPPSCHLCKESSKLFMPMGR